MANQMKMTRRQSIAAGTIGALGVLGAFHPKALFAANEPPATQNKSGKVTLLQINDCHGYLDLHMEWFPGHDGIPIFRPAGGYARIATLVKQITEDTQGGVLFCDNGDTFHGTYPVVESRGQAAVPILKQMGFHAMTAHWDFAYGPARLKELASQLSYPLLAINIYDKKTGNRFFEPYRILNVGTLKIGMIGVACDIVDKIMPASFAEGLRFTTGLEELPRMIKEVRAHHGVGLVVVLSHLGFPQDMRLLSEVQGVDVLLSGHTHDRLYAPVLQNGALVIQSGCHGSFLGRLDLDIEDGKVAAYRHQLIEVAETIPPDAAVGALVKQALAPYAAELDREVGELATGLDRDRCLEATMDNFLLNAVRDAAGTELAFSNGWRWGAPIRPGKVTLNELHNIVPMSIPISTVELTGAELKELLEDNLHNTFASNPLEQEGGYVKRCLGLTVYIRIENPRGTRVTRLFAGDKEVEADKIYTAAFLTVQAVPAKYNRNRRDLPDHPVDAMLAYLRKHRPARVEIGNSVVAF
jgi:2',3'-cyclic-nucleotide 2'-phosphodiesterase (5'-nucleotidase family)